MRRPTRHAARHAARHATRRASRRSSRRLAILVVTGAVAVAAGACSKGSDTTSSAGTSLQGTVAFPSTTAGGPGTTTGPTIPDEAKLPTGTAWPAAPDPCSLATETDVRKVTRFNVTSIMRPAKTPTGGPTTVCLFKNQVADIEGGSVTITVLPPGTDVGRDLSSLTNVQMPSGIGVKAIAGHVKDNPTGGQGMNIIAVDMGDGGFSIGAFVFADIDDQAMLDLARVAASHWKVTPK